MRTAHQSIMQLLLLIARSAGFLSLLLVVSAAKNNDATAAAETSTLEIDYRTRQVDWVRSKGGFFSPKVEIRRADPQDPTSHFGVFAKEDLALGESILTLPTACMLTSGRVQAREQHICYTTRNLMKQRDLGPESEFAPYVEYLFQPQDPLPAAWSPEGQELITTILGSELPPFDVTGISFADECHGDPNDHEAQAVYLQVVRRSWDDKLLPLVDMINHRNGHWKNVDSNSAHEGNDVTVYALRDIQAGEELYLSYNECKDCDFALTYVLPHIFKDFGFIEQYPRRWLFEAGEEEFIVFELDRPEENKNDNDDEKNNDTDKDLRIRWLSKMPNKYEYQFLRAHLKRLKGLQDYVTTQSQKIASDHEKNISLEYYHALMTALEYAIWSTQDAADYRREQLLKSQKQESECELSANGETGQCGDNCSRVYDALEKVTDRVKFNDYPCNFDIAQHSNDGVRVDQDKSFYSEILFEHSQENDDTCLHLNDVLQACYSFRPHYHEVFVHYPARFLDSVKRIAFIGGGDNMILHEILKYPDLEFVVGMELDQAVVRKSFKNMGTQPHFDNEKVQWWFGDGSKSITMLPKEYFGTFDLVLLDLETDVVRMLKVAKDRDIMDAALLLLKPDGVIARNEDFEFGTNTPFARYTIDLLYGDVPMICHQGITIGSNGVDFLTHPMTDHGVDNIILPPLDKTKSRFDLWYNYQQTDTQSKRLCQEWPEEAISNPGVLMIVEAENASIPLESTSTVRDAIIKALGTSGLTLIDSDIPVDTGDAEGYELFFLLREGYVMLRTWNTEKYCAFDLLMWSSFEKQNAAKSLLVEAVGSSSSSSFRVATSGMYGPSQDGNGFSGPRSNGMCTPSDDTQRQTTVDADVIAKIIGESLPLIQNAARLVAVVCGDESLPCPTLNVLKEQRPDATAVPLWACSDVSQRMLECESSTLERIALDVATNGKVGGILIDPQAPLEMGQILHKIFSKAINRRELLGVEHAVIAPTLDVTDTWRVALADRFRTEIAEFDPAYRASILLNSSSTSAGLAIFSSGDSDFFLHLMSTISRIETKTGLVSDIRSIRNGINNYVADFKASRVVTHNDYDASAPLDQWLHQMPLAEQMVLMFVVSEPSKENLSTDVLRSYLETALAVMNNHKFQLFTQMHDNVGDGCVIVTFWELGNAILTWDGKDHFSVNLATYEGSSTQYFAEVLDQKMHSAKIQAQDDVPRGIGRVVNFDSDLGSQLPHWAKRVERD